MSSNKLILKASGLYTDPNLLSEVHEGALVEANNVIIDRDSIIQSRRGNATYGNTIGSSDDRANQFLTYKNRLLPHFEETLLFNSVDHTENTTGSFLAFSGTYSEVTPGLRLKSVESNKNLYFTTSDGIKKISARTAADFTTASGFIRDAGVLTALDVTGELDFSSDGFLPAVSKVGYAIVWGYKDLNNNVLYGAPSTRFVITNYSTVSANVDLQFTVPAGITSEYFYQVFRTGIVTATATLGIDDIDPGNDMNLVIEDFPTPSQISAGEVDVTDIAPDDFRQNGLPLYTSPNIGQGINQANYPPPKAKDVAMYQNTVFYANTETLASKQINLLGVDGLVSLTSYIQITDGTTPYQYIFVGAKEITQVSFTSYIGTIPADLNGKYWLMNSSSNIRKYYIWYDTTLTTQTLDFTNYIGTIPSDLDTRYIIIPTSGTNTYYIWFDATGTSVDPGLNPANTQLAGLLSIRVDISASTTKADVAAASAGALTTNNVFNDYDVNYTATDTFLTLDTEAFDTEDSTTGDNVQKGFVYSATTPANSNPANTPLVNTDVVGRIGFRISVARNVTTTAEVPDATAAGILAQDTAQDFVVTYTPAATLLTVTNSNNGKADDAKDSLIEGLGNGFAITTTQQGNGEDAALLHVLLSAAATPSQQIDETAQSLVRVINKNPLEIVNARYLSGPNDLPGQILLTARDIGTNFFSLSANNALTATRFNPPLPPAAGAAPVEGIPEIKPNRLYYAKTQQPEAVPLLNYIDIGPEDQEISRILALREALFVLKADGVYRVTGQNGSFSDILLDGNAKINAPDSAVTLNNQIYALTNQGIVQISDTGVTVISERLDNVIKVLTSDQYDFRHTTFGVTYETDRAYILWMPSIKTDDVATQAFRYNISTKAWTLWPISKKCGLVNPGDNRLYLGPADKNYVERERKNFDRTDYADRQNNYSLTADAIDGTSMTLPTANIAVIGDAITQTQYLTISQYNQLLRKLDLDPYIDNDYISELEAVPGDNLKTKLDDLAVKLDSDPGISQTDFLASIASHSGVAANVSVANPTVITYANNGVWTGRVVDITASTSTPNINGSYVATRINANQFSIPIAVSVSGTCSYSIATNTFLDLQGMFNVIVNKLNSDSGVLSSNYPLSSGTFTLEVLITDETINVSTVQVQYEMAFIQGLITIYDGITTSVLYAPDHFGDASVSKQVREGTFLFENMTFSGATVGYKTDIQPGLSLISFGEPGNGDYSGFPWSNQNWGGGFSGVPFRTLIPAAKQRCRYIQAYFTNNKARESWGLLGISYVFRAVSSRAWRR